MIKFHKNDNLLSMENFAVSSICSDKSIKLCKCSYDPQKANNFFKWVFELANGKIKSDQVKIYIMILFSYRTPKISLILALS